MNSQQASEAFRQIEMNFDWRDDFSNLIYGYDKSLFSALKNNARKKSLSESLTENDYLKRMRVLDKFLCDLKLAFEYKKNYGSGSENSDEKTDVMLWHHRDRHEIEQCENGDHCVDKKELSDVALKYLSNSWLHHPAIDYWFLDALVYFELASFRDNFLAGKFGADDSFVVRNWYNTKGDLDELIKKDAFLDKRNWLKKRIFEFVGLDLVAPIIIAFTFFSFSKILGIVFATFYVSALIGMNERERGEISNCKERLLFLRMLSNLYQIFKGDQIDLNHLKSVATRYSSQTTGYLYSGICLDPIFHVILAKSIKINPDGILFHQRELNYTESPT
jgi:hypothetical protein